jgi:hypothetical protein
LEVLEGDDTSKGCFVGMGQFLREPSLQLVELGSLSFVAQVLA